MSSGWIAIFEGPTRPDETVRPGRRRRSNRYCDVPSKKRPGDSFFFFGRADLDPQSRAVTEGEILPMQVLVVGHHRPSSWLQRTL